MNYLRLQRCSPRLKALLPLEGRSTTGLQRTSARLIDFKFLAISLKNRFADPLYFQQLIQRCKRPITVPISNNRFCFRLTYSRKFTLQDRRIGAIQIDLASLLRLSHILHERWGGRI